MIFISKILFYLENDFSIMEIIFVSENEFRIEK